jgi:hypothetical protein
MLVSLRELNRGREAPDATRKPILSLDLKRQEEVVVLRPQGKISCHRRWVNLDRRYCFIGIQKFSN